MNDIINLMKGHRSIRRYAPDPVPEKDVLAAVEAGQAASTSSAVQAYCLVRITDMAKRRKLVELTGGQKKVAESGSFFVVCGDVRRHRLVARRAGRPYEASMEAFLVAVIDASLFAQNLVLAFESMGYGICYIGGLRDDLPAADRLLGLPEGVYPLFGLCVGVPAETPRHRPRLPLEAVLFDDVYPDDDAMLAWVDECDEPYRAYLQYRGRRPRGWTEVIADKYATPARAGLAAYYAGKGADLA